MIQRPMMRSIDDPVGTAYRPHFYKPSRNANNCVNRQTIGVSTNTETPPTSRWSCQVDRYVPQCVGLTEVKA